MHTEGKTESFTEERWAKGHFQSCLEAMLDGFGLYTAIRDLSGEIADFRIEYVNEAACRLNRLTRSQQEGKRLLEVLPALLETGLFDQYCQVVETGEPLAKESLVYGETCDGARQRLARAFDLKAARLGDGFVATWRDVTEREEVKRLSESLNRFNATVIALMDPGKIMKAIAETGASTLGADSSIIWLREDGFWAVNHVFGLPAELKGQRFPERIAKVLSLVAKTRKPLIVEDAYEDKRINRSFVRSYKIKAGLTHPLIVEDKVIGVISYMYRTKRKFDDVQLDFVYKLASSTSLALSNARLFDAERKARRKARTGLNMSNSLLAAADALASITELPDLLNLLLETLTKLTGRTRVAINFWNDETDELAVVVATGEFALPAGTAFTSDQLLGAARRALRTKEMVIIDDEDPSTAKEEKKRMEALHARMVLYVPMVIGDRVIGALEIDEPDVHDEFKSREMYLVEAVASQAAVAIERARLYDEERLGKKLSDVLNIINQAIHSRQNDDVLKLAVKMAAKALGAESARIVFREDGRWRSKFCYGRLEATEDKILPGSDLPIAAAAASTAMPVVIKDAQNDPRFNPAEMNRLNIGSALHVPLEWRGEVSGVLAFYHHSRPVAFSSIQTDFAIKLASSLSLALENIKLFDQQRHVAQTLQDALLLMPKHVPGMELAFLYKGATEFAKVGGDFYDVFELENDHVGILVGDVSGKGLEAATLTSVVKYTIKAYCHDGESLSSVMQKTNQVLCKNSPPQSFVTVFLAKLNTRTGNLTYCNAGHLHPVIKKGKSLRVLDGTCTAIGIFDDLKYGDFHDRIEMSEILIAYSDGVTEARKKSEIFGEKRLMGLLSGCPQQPARIPARIMKEVLSFSGGVLKDDVAILAAKFLGRGKEEIPV